MAPAILWFRRNLRLRDNAAVSAAVASGRPIIAVYVLDELDSGSAIRWWLHHSLKSLDSDLLSLGSSLVLLSGSPVSVLLQLAEQSAADAIFYARRCEPQARHQEESLQASIGTRARIQAFDDSYLNHHDSLLTKGKTPFRVFTPYWKTASARPNPAVPQPAPMSMVFASHSIQSLSLDDLKLQPAAPNWAQKFDQIWTPGEEGALRRLDDIDQVALHYAEHRDRPDLDNTSHLSAHLHFGEVSVRQVWHAVQASAARLQADVGAAALLRQLYWRDFSAYLLIHFPTLVDTPLRSEFEHFPWSDDSRLRSAWQYGMTGYPIVDAGMRQLWTTGWMHNRVRMIVASFLVKDLLVPWQRGADWFLDTLVDADLANISASWQWVAGCGTDAAPYFRIFNPILQGKRFDPHGNYVRRWVPEIAAMPNEYIHEPWCANHRMQATCDVVIGEDYPPPIVDHSDARHEALAAYRLTRSAASAESACSS